MYIYICIYCCRVFNNLFISNGIKHISKIKHCKISLHSHQDVKYNGRRCAECWQNHNSLVHVSGSNKINEPTISITMSGEKETDCSDYTVYID